MPVNTNPDVGYFVTPSECEAYKAEISRAADLLQGRVTRNRAALEASLEGQEWLAAWELWRQRLAAHLSESCWWGGTTAAGIELARAFNGLEASYLGLSGEDPISFFTPEDATPGGGFPWGWVALLAGLGVTAFGIYAYMRTTPIPNYRRSRRRKKKKPRSLGATRVSGPRGRTSYNLEM